MSRQNQREKITKETSEGRRKIVVSKSGPYIVYGDVPLSIHPITPNEEGFSWDWVE